MDTRYRKLGVPYVPPDPRGGLDQVREDPEPNPPHREGGEPPERLRGEGHSVVRADARGQAVLLKIPYAVHSSVMGAAPFCTSWANWRRSCMFCYLCI